MNDFKVRPLKVNDREWVARVLRENWGSTTVVSRGKIHQADIYPGFIATYDSEGMGLITYRIEGKECEIVTLNSLEEGIGVGTSLITAVTNAAVNKSCRRVWLITSNDNMDAVMFYQKRGFRLVAIHRDAITEARKKLKPEIPLYGIESIPIRDEIEMEIIL
jgi:ribosomal protein S18 acetylase RimI-like enzyme